MIDIKKIVEDKTNEMLNEGAIELAVKESVEKSIKSAIKDVLTSYKFEHAIEDKLKVEVSSCLEEIHFSGYRELMLAQMTKVINDLKTEDFATRAENEFKKFFVASEEIITLEKIVELARELYMTGDGTRWDENFYLDIKFHDRCNQESEMQWLDVNISEEDPGTSSYSSRKKDAQYQLTFYRYKKENSGYILKTIKLDGIKFSWESKTISSITRLNELQEVLLNSYLNGKEIMIEYFDADDYNTSLGDED